jgi:hypothetical protein
MYVYIYVYIYMYMYMCTYTYTYANNECVAIVLGMLEYNPVTDTYLYFRILSQVMCGNMIQPRVLQC